MVYLFMANMLSFPIVILPVKVDCGIFSGEEISQLDLMYSWHLSCYHAGIHCFYNISLPRCLILSTSGHGSDWNTWCGVNETRRVHRSSFWDILLNAAAAHRLPAAHTLRHNSQLSLPKPCFPVFNTACVIADAVQVRPNGTADHTSPHLNLVI